MNCQDTYNKINIYFWININYKKIKNKKSKIKNKK